VDYHGGVIAELAALGITVIVVKALDKGASMTEVFTNVTISCDTQLRFISRMISRNHMFAGSL